MVKYGVITYLRTYKAALMRRKRRIYIYILRFSGHMAAFLSLKIPHPVHRDFANLCQERFANHHLKRYDLLNV